MKKVILFTYLQRHLNKMLPIIEELQKKEEIDLTVLLMTQEEKEIAKNHNIIYKMLDEYIDRPRIKDFDLGWGLEPLIHAIDAVRPDMFIAIEVNYILRNAIRHCKRQGIPTVVIQHGTPNKYSLHAFAPFEGDCFLAWGDFTREFLIKNHVDSDKIIVTGGVPFDRTLTLRPDRLQIAQELNISSDHKWILFTTQGVGSNNCPSEEEIRIAVQETAKVSGLYPDVQLIYQVHPSQSIDFIAGMLEEIQVGDSIVLRYPDTETLIAASDAVITFFSTTAIDAVVLQKPLLLITLTEDHDFLPFVKMGAAYGALTKEQIPEMFNRVILDEGTLRANQIIAAAYVSYKNDGQALYRIMDIIYNKLELCQ